MPTRRSYIGGYSLLELLIIIVILIVVTVYALNRFANFSQTSKGIVEQALISALQTAINLYHTRHLKWPDWTEPDNPFILLKDAPTGWDFKRHEDSSGNYWWLRCPHNKIWWNYVIRDGKIHMHCSKNPNQIYPAGKVIRCWKTPITHDFEEERDKHRSQLIQEKTLPNNINKFSFTGQF